MAVRASGVVHSPRARERIAMPRKRYESQREAEKRYRAKNPPKKITLNFLAPEMDIYEHVKTKEQMSTYIKDLIRADMEKQK